MRAITVPKIIDIAPGVLRGSPDRVEVEVCVLCGMVVFDTYLHESWHRLLEATTATSARHIPGKPDS